MMFQQLPQSDGSPCCGQMCGEGLIWEIAKESKRAIGEVGKMVHLEELVHFRI